MDGICWDMATAQWNEYTEYIFNYL